MKNKKTLFNIFALTFIIVIGNVFFISGNQCWVVTKNNCDPSNTLMGIYSYTNTHGSIQEETHVVCCDFGSQYGCDAHNIVIYLNNNANSHAEVPRLGSQNYGQMVCYGGLKNCDFTNENCGSDELEIVRLSNYTNAHIESADSNNYDYKICCEVTEDEPPSSCELNSASWNETIVKAGSKVRMNVGGTECDGEDIQFDIKSSGQTKDGVSGQYPFGEWLTKTFDDAYSQNFTFTALSQTSSELRVVNCSQIKVNSCGDYEGEFFCNENFCEVEGTGMSGCIWESNECKDYKDEVDSDGNVIGRCILTSTGSEGNCDEGDEFIILTLMGSWEWDNNCDEGCKETNSNKKSECEQERRRRFECPGQILLSFFNSLNFLVTLVIVLTIYTISGILKKKKIKIKIK